MLLSYLSKLVDLGLTILLDLEIRSCLIVLDIGSCPIVVEKKEPEDGLVSPDNKMDSFGLFLGLIIPSAITLPLSLYFPSGLDDIIYLLS